MSYYAPYAVGTFLYYGISNQINHISKMCDSAYWSDYYATQVIRLKEAIEWYKEHCVAGCVHLEKEYDDLLSLISDKFIYDGDRFYRFTLKCKLMVDVEREQLNCLIVKNKFLEMLPTVGLIFKTDEGRYARIVEVFDSSNTEKMDSYGKFLAEQLDINEVIQMKKGG